MRLAVALEERQRRIRDDVERAGTLSIRPNKARRGVRRKDPGLKSPNRCLRVITLCLVAASCGGDAYAANGARPDLHLRAEPVVHAADDIRLRVTAENTGKRCAPVYVDPAISPFRYPSRPVMQVSVTLRDSAGRALTPRAKPIAPAVMGTRPEQLLLLECGMIIGGYVHLSRFGWPKLPSGTYSGELTLEADTYSFATRTPGYIERLAELSGLKRDDVLSRLPRTSATTKFRLVIP